MILLLRHLKIHCIGIYNYKKEFIIKKYYTMVANKLFYMSYYYSFHDYVVEVVLQLTVLQKNQCAMVDTSVVSESTIKNI